MCPGIRYLEWLEERKIPLDAFIGCLALFPGIGLEEDTFTGHILVCDLGKEVLDVTLLHSSRGFMRTLSSRTFHGLGGAVLDAALVGLLKEEYRRSVKLICLRGCCY